MRIVRFVDHSQVRENEQNGNSYYLGQKKKKKGKEDTRAVV